MLTRLRNRLLPLDDEVRRAAAADLKKTGAIIVRGLACYIAAQELYARGIELLIRDTGLAKHLPGVAAADEAAATEGKQAHEQAWREGEKFRDGYALGQRNAVGHTWLYLSDAHGMRIPNRVRADIRTLQEEGNWFGEPVVFEDEIPAQTTPSDDVDEHLAHEHDAPAIPPADPARAVRSDDAG